jgi:hypothetical protein
LTPTRLGMIDVGFRSSLFLSLSTFVSRRCGTGAQRRCTAVSPAGSMSPKSLEQTPRQWRRHTLENCLCSERPASDPGTFRLLVLLCFPGIAHTTLRGSSGPSPLSSSIDLRSTRSDDCDPRGRGTPCAQSRSKDLRRSGAGSRRRSRTKSGGRQTKRPPPHKGEGWPSEIVPAPHSVCCVLPRAIRGGQTGCALLPRCHGSLRQTKNPRAAREAGGPRASRW